jgi:hypothetical protein
MESLAESPEEIEEAYLLLQDAAESAALDTRSVKPTVGQAYKIFTFATLGYLLLDLLSTYVPGPGQWVGLDQHVQLFHRIATLF